MEKFDHFPVVGLMMARSGDHDGKFDELGDQSESGWARDFDDQSRGSVALNNVFSANS